jgi:predicted CXXCH cytochrome family protein
MLTSGDQAMPMRAVRSGLLGVLAGLAFLFAGDGAAAQTALSQPDQACLRCHGNPGLHKRFDNGDTISLQVDGEDFANSVHRQMGCLSCHSNIRPAQHPGAPQGMPTARDYALAAVQACRGCHSDKFQQFQDSIHASRLREGDPGAPLCTNCHRPHAVIKGVAQNVETVPCKTCHGPTLDAYLPSVHGQARLANKPGAPLCSGCHTAHAITAAAVAMEDQTKSACTGCHADVVEQHKTWLPNTELHFTSVSCQACHAPKARRKVDLKLIDAKTQQRVSDQRGVPIMYERSFETQGRGLNALALWNLLNTFNTQGLAGKTELRGRLEVMSGAEAHQLTDAASAISDCAACHQKGAEAFQTVTVSIAGPDGRPVRIGASEDVLSSVIALDSVSGFYVIGGTRMGWLDVLFLLALAAGLAIPIGHFTVRQLFRLYAKQRAAQ